jgi:hypothetical protein
MQKSKLGVTQFTCAVLALPFLIVGEICRALWKVCDSIVDAIMGDRC